MHISLQRVDGGVDTGQRIDPIWTKDGQDSTLSDLCAYLQAAGLLAWLQAILALALIVAVITWMWRCRRFRRPCCSAHQKTHEGLFMTLAAAGIVLAVLDGLSRAVAMLPLWAEGDGPLEGEALRLLAELIADGIPSAMVAFGMFVLAWMSWELNRQRECRVPVTPPG